MRELRDILAALPAFDADTQRTAVDAWVAEKGCKPWNAWRVCLVGQGKGPDMHELAAFLGREELLHHWCELVLFCGHIIFFKVDK